MQMENRNEPCRTACVIMASGMGKRFGGNKLLADFRGQPLIARILAATDTPLFVRRIVVTRHEEILQLCRDRRIDCLLHKRPGRNDTIRLGLEALTLAVPAADCTGSFVSRPDAPQTPLSGCCFCAADQPCLSKSSVERLIRAFFAHPDLICRCTHQNQPGNPVIFPAEFFPRLMKLPADAGGGWIIKQYPDRLLPVPVADAAELADIDTVSDLERLSRQTGAP